jgi:dsRNA-specific ribonuclease
LYTLSGANSIPEDTFKYPVVGIYLHGVLLGIAHGKSYKLARTVAAKEALNTIHNLTEKLELFAYLRTHG